MLSLIQSVVCLMLSIASVYSLVVPPAQSEPYILDLARLGLVGHVNLTSTPWALRNPRLGASEAQCSEREWGHTLETSNVEAAFARIPNDPAPRVFSLTPMTGAVKVPARFLGMCHVLDAS